MIADDSIQNAIDAMWYACKKFYSNPIGHVPYRGDTDNVKRNTSRNVRKLWHVDN